MKSSRLKGWMALMALAASVATAFWTFPAAAVVVRGQGTSESQAVDDALRRAVEQAVGVTVQSRVAVQDFEVVRSTMVTHASGYVRTYSVLSRSQDGRGLHSVEIDAQVDEGRIGGNADALAVLMRLSGQPSVVVLGLDDGVRTLGVVGGGFADLRRQVSSTFAEEFHFRVLDPGPVPVAATASRGAALSFAKAARADYVVLIRTSAQQADVTRMFAGEIALEAVRLGDAFSVGKESAELVLPTMGGPLSDREVSQRVTGMVGERAFPLSAQLARAMAGSLQDETSAGGGVRYVLRYSAFPDGRGALIEEALAAASGTLRQEVISRSNRDGEIVLFSHAQATAVAESVIDYLRGKGVTAKYRIDGRTLQIRHVYPGFE